jgi:hypothetical protein
MTIFGVATIFRRKGFAPLRTRPSTRDLFTFNAGNTRVRFRPHPHTFPRKNFMMDQRIQFLTNSDEFQILSTTLTGDSGWVDIGQYRAWSVFFTGIETGAVVTVELMNKLTVPLAGDKGTSSTLTVDANANASFESNAKPYHWLRLKKVQGGTPTASIAIMFGAR